MSLTSEMLLEWAIREKAYYAEAEKSKAVQENMKKQHDEQLVEWKRKDEEYEKYLKKERIFEEIKKYNQEEINIAMQQIKIDRLKELLKEYQYLNQPIIIF